MAEVTLTHSQAYEAVQEYLAEFLRQATNATLRNVLSDTSPYIWMEGPGDPAVPWDWSNAAAVVARRPHPAAFSQGQQQMVVALPEQAWLPALYPFLDSMRSILGYLSLARLLELLAQPDVVLDGSELSPWQLWLDATEAITHAA